MRPLLASLLMLALLVSGCASVGERVQTLRGDEPTPAPYYREWRATLDAEHDRQYAFPVAKGAQAVQVVLNLSSRTNGLPLPPEAPARATVELLDAQGVRLAQAVVDPQQPVADLALAAPLAAGQYAVRVQGMGASHTLEGTPYGAAYLLTVEALYG